MTARAKSTRNWCCGMTGWKAWFFTAMSTDSGWYFELLRKREDVSAFRDGLLFGQEYA